MEDKESFHLEQFTRYRRELLKSNPCVPYTAANRLSRPRTCDASRMAYSRYLDEFERELSNAINELITYTKRLSAWSKVLVGLDLDQRFELTHEMIAPLATTALNAPYAIRSRFCFAAAHLSHQANKFKMGEAWKDDLPEDRKITEEVAHRYSKNWTRWSELVAALNKTAGRSLSDASDDFRRKYNHRFSPHFEVGLTQFVKRIPFDVLPPEVRAVMHHRSSDATGGQRFVDAYGESQPLMISDIVSALEKECGFFQDALLKFDALIEEQIAVVFGRANPDDKNLC